MARFVAAALAGVLFLAVPAVPAAAPATSTFVALNGEAGEFVSRGRDWHYDRNKAVIGAVYRDGAVRVSVHGEEIWHGEFHAPAGSGRLTEGRYPHDDDDGRMWSGHGRSCNRANGWFEVTDIAFRHGEMTRVALRFAQRCEEIGAPTLRGTLAWDAVTSAPRLQNPRPEPAGAWRPPAGAIPERGNVVYLQSDDGDWVGAGKTLLYRPSSEKLEVGTDHTNLIRVRLMQTPWWSGEFAAPMLDGQLRRAHYAAINRYPFDNPLEGGMAWAGDGRGCNQAFSWFTVDRLRKVAGEIRAFSLRFVQRCESPNNPALRGYIRWRATTPAPQQPFRDLVGHRHELALTRVAAEGWMRGHADGTFRPQGHVTRGQIATILHRYMGWGAPSDDAPNFSDIANSPHRDAIRRLAQAGYIDGYPDGTFRPDVPITRGKLATLIDRVFLFDAGLRHPEFYFDALGTPNDFATRALIANDLTRRVGDGRYRPGDLTTRGHTGLLLARAAGLVADLRR